jgi:hypothetical protein
MENSKEKSEFYAWTKLNFANYVHSPVGGNFITAV